MASHTILAARGTVRPKAGIPRPPASGGSPILGRLSERGLMTGYESMPSMPDMAPTHHENELLQAKPQARPAVPLASFGRKGTLEMRLARTAREIDAAQALRYRVFYEEMSATPNAEMRSLKRDFDRFDAFCDHLLVFDRSLAGVDGQDMSGAVVGCYRLLSQDVAASNGGFYTAGEYNLDSLLKLRDQGLRFVELGRSCVLPAYRTKPTIELLWHGIMQYVATHHLDVMFGCASFEGTDPAALALPLSYLHHYHPTPSGWHVRAVEERFVDMNLIPKEKIDTREAWRQLPPMIKGYLRAGCTIGNGAVVDAQFGTTDVFILSHIAQMSTRYFTKFSPQPSE